MDRHQMIQQVESTPGWDICIIGGGATGLGIAVDATTRGFKTVLFEQHDFAKGTSSRSTKLVHGGVRYLQQGNIKLVLEALKERGLLIKNAPHLVHNQKFVLPNYKWWEGPFYGIGLKIYDWMAGKLGLGPSQFLSKDETLQLAPTLDPEGLRGGIVYHDGQFDDARLAIDLAQTAASFGGSLLNYFPVKGILKTNKKACGVQVKDALTGKAYEIKSKVVINATGVFTDAVMNMDNPKHRPIVTPSQGIHLVVDKEFLPGDTAIMIPRTDDGRVLFAVPWHNKLILGTTDTPVRYSDNGSLLEPRPQHDEVDFILMHIGRYLSKDPARKDVRSMFAGLRPLVKESSKRTASLSREHLVSVAESGMITITGGKWTTYRKMAEDVLDFAIQKNKLASRPCVTKELKLYGIDKELLPANVSNLDRSRLTSAIRTSVKNEMCLTVEDFLARRTRTLLLDARAAIELAPAVASLMAAEMQKDEQWTKDQIESFTLTANNYLPESN
jgi:glycerol-3-phosphate dehydrogenase